MGLAPRREGWWRAAVLVLLSLALYYLNVLLFLFLVPLQVLYSRRGKGDYLIGAAIIALVVGAVGFLRSAALGGVGVRLAASGAEVLFSIGFTGGLFVVNAGMGRVKRPLFRLLVVTGIVGAASVPLVLIGASSAALTDFVRTQVQAAVQLVQSSFGAQDGSGAGFAGIDVNKLVAFVQQTAMRTFLFTYFAILALSYRVGGALSVRRWEDRVQPLARFALPEFVLWPVLVAWAAVLADRLFGLGTAGYYAWNLGLIGAFLYGLQGIGVAQHLLARWRVPRLLRMLVGVITIGLLVTPGVGTIVLILVPVLGISELWIHFRRIEDRSQQP